MNMDDRIKKIIKEETTGKKKFKYSEGGYLVPCDKNEKSDIELTQEEYKKIKELNGKLKELYELEKERLNLKIKHNKGVIQHVIGKLRNK
jgi:hypothetical protein